MLRSNPFRFAALVVTEPSRSSGDVLAEAAASGFPDWKDVQSLTRLAIQVSKGVMLLHTEAPEGLNHRSPTCLLHFDVHEVEVCRWNPHRHRDAVYDNAMWGEEDDAPAPAAAGSKRKAKASFD